MEGFKQRINIGVWGIGKSRFTVIHIEKKHAGYDYYNTLINSVFHVVTTLYTQILTVLADHCIELRLLGAGPLLSDTLSLSGFQKMIFFP